MHIHLWIPETKREERRYPNVTVLSPGAASGTNSCFYNPGERTLFNKHILSCEKVHNVLRGCQALWVMSLYLGRGVGEHGISKPNQGEPRKPVPFISFIACQGFAYETMASFTPFFILQPGEEGAQWAQTLMLDLGRGRRTVSRAGASAGLRPGPLCWLCGSVAPLHHRCADGFAVPTCPLSEECRMLFTRKT